jgi:Zn-dependent M16 (insulinase) family peptidase
MLFDKYETDNKFTFKEEILNEGFMAPIDVNFVAKGGFVDDKFNGSIKTLNNYLSMAYLWQVVRVKGGAYGCSSRVVENQSIGFVSYRDPNIISTIEAYQNIPTWINSLDLSNDELTQAKIGAIGLLDDSCHVSMKGDRALIRVLTHTTFDDVKKNRLELINCTLEDVKNNSKLYQKALNSNAICVIGNKDKILENKKLFKEIKNLF